MIENAVFQTVLALLSAALNGTEFSGPADPALWPAVKKELQEQTVLALTNDILQKSGLCDEAEKQQLTGLTAANIYLFLGLMTQQQEAAELLQENHIPVAVLKGAACGQYYADPGLRCYGDIDLLVLPKDYGSALRLFREKGYRQLQAEDAAYQRHIGFMTPSGVEIELHRFFSSSGNGEQNALLDGWLFDAFGRIEQARAGQFTVPVFPAAENGLVILGHINHHLSGGLGLRQIADWMMYVKAELSDAFWEQQFRSRAEAIGMAYLAKTVTRMCRLYLGLSADITWCDDADDDLAEELLLYILEKGNHGRKTDRDAKSTLTVLHKCSDPVKLFRYLTEAGTVHMKEAGLRPVKAFAWAYQIGHLLRKTAKRKNKKTLFREVRRGTEETDLLERLKVTRL